MPDLILTLDALCDVLSDILRTTNAELGRDPPPAHDVDAAAAACRVERHTKYSLRKQPYCESPCARRYQLGELCFSVACFVVTHRVGTHRQMALALRAPAWWTRIGRPLVCIQLKIGIDANSIALRFIASERPAAARNGNRWVLRLSDAQRASLSASLEHTTKPARAASFHRRIAKWLRRTATKSA
jgi:hypothetical protein